MSFNLVILDRLMPCIGMEIPFNKLTLGLNFAKTTVVCAHA